MWAEKAALRELRSPRRRSRAFNLRAARLPVIAGADGVAFENLEEFAERRAQSQSGQSSFYVPTSFESRDVFTI